MPEPAVILVRMQPPQECSPNSRAHWRQKARAVEAFRAEAKKAAQYEASEGVRAFRGRLDPVRLRVDIGWCCGRKRMDDDNARASLKPLIDGIADVLWFGHDEHVTIERVNQGTGGCGCVRVVIEGADTETPDPMASPAGARGGE